MEKMKPILFSTPMVKAIFAGEKTQTRRVILWHKKTPDNFGGKLLYKMVTELNGKPFFGAGFYDESRVFEHNGEKTIDAFYLPCKIKPGDILWVREAWLKVEYPAIGGGIGHYFIYRADDPENKTEKWKSSRYMPREAARIFLEVKSVRVERVQNITLGDVQSEGIVMDEPPNIRNSGKPKNYDKWTQAEKDHFIRGLATHIYMADQNYIERHINKYAKLWDSINAKRGHSWESNSWVWVIEFEKIEKGGK